MLHKTPTRCALAAAILILAAGCGGGGGDDQVAAAPPPPPATNPQPAPSPGAPAPAPGVAPTPIAPPATPPKDPASPTPVPSPQPAPAPTPTPAPQPSPSPAPEPTPPAPVPAPEIPGRVLDGQALSRWLVASTSPIHGPPGEIFEEGYSYENPSSLGSIWAIQSNYGGTYSYSNAQFKYGTNPYWALPMIRLSVPISPQDGQVWLGREMTVVIDDRETVVLTHESGEGFTIDPAAKYALDQTVTQWTQPGTPYYVQLQVGIYNDPKYGEFHRSCWHMRLPGVLRRNCLLWYQVGMDGKWWWNNGGDHIIDDSNTRFGPRTFVYTYKYQP